MLYSMSSKENTRARILNATLNLISSQPQEVSIGRIAKLAGISRQAVYLHFASKSELYVAAAQHTDIKHDLDGHLVPVRAARTAEELLKRHAQFLAKYNPLIYPVVRAVDALRRGDPDLEASWHDRLANRRAGCLEIATRISTWNRLAPGWTVPTAGDWLTVQSSVKVWEELVLDLGWSSKRYASVVTRSATAVLLSNESLE